MKLFDPNKNNAKEHSTYCVIGLGRFGSAVATHLCENGRTVIVADSDPTRVEHMRAYTPYAFVMNHMSKEALEEIGVKNADVAIVGIGSSLDVSILTTLHLINLGIKKVIAKATSAEHGQILERLGAEVVYPEKDMGIQLAVQLLSRSLVGYLALNNSINVYELKVPSSLLGKTIFEENIRGRFGLNIVAIERNKQTITHITPQTQFEKDDNIVVIGSVDEVQKFEDYFASDYAQLEDKKRE
jgi:trk system potassium uptake protein TrkA